MARQHQSGIVRSTHILLAAVLLILCGPAKTLAAPPQAGRVAYQLRYAGGNDPRVSLRITPESPLAAPVALVIPRSYPGGYSFVPYDDFIEDVRAVSPDGKSIECKKDDDGPRWAVGQDGESVSLIEYRVNVGRMEERIRESVESSKIRKDYVGLLGYSVFGYIDGLEQAPVTLQVDCPGDWPVLTTLDPRATVLKGTAKAQAANYDILADSQVVMGPGVQFRDRTGKIDLLMAVYSEGEEDVDAESKLAREALDRVQEYFDDTPFPVYTVLLANCFGCAKATTTTSVRNTIPAAHSAFPSIGRPMPTQRNLTFIPRSSIMRTIWLTPGSRNVSGASVIGRSPGNCLLSLKRSGLTRDLAAMLECRRWRRDCRRKSERPGGNARSRGCEAS